jgi:SAM-dependent methyltransferase
VTPYLVGPLRDAFDAWLEASLARFLPPLTFPELRRGVQALSSLYVERRAEGRLSERALAGAAKRAAFACFYAPLHFLTLHHALAELGWPDAEPARIADLGCGSGAAGAAVATRFTRRPPLLGVDRSGFALAEARHTYRAFGVAARTRRGALPGALPAPRAGDLWVLGWTVNECAPAIEVDLRTRLAQAAAADVAYVVAEPLATAATPWWREWERALAPAGAKSAEVKVRVELPPPLARLDRAAGLDHRLLGARVLFGPGVAS